MSVATGYVAHGILLPSTAFLSQLNDLTPANNIEELVGLAAGHPMPMFAGVMAAAPDVVFETPQIKTLLTATGLTGLDCSTGNTDVFFKKAQDLGLRVANASLAHLRLRATQAFLYWKSIEAEQRQVAKAMSRLATTYDGTNLPLVPAGSLALAGTPTADEFYTMGPVKLESSFIPGLKKWRLDLGYQTHEEDADGDEYRTFFCAKELNPVVLTLTTIEATNWTSYGLSGLAFTAISFWLKRIQNLGGHYGAGVAQHIKFSNSKGIVLLDKSSSGQNNLVSPEIRILLVAEDAATNPVTINTASTIA